MNQLESYLYKLREHFSKIIRQNNSLINSDDKDIRRHKNSFFEEIDKAQAELKLVNEAITWYEQNKNPHVGVGSRFYSDYFRCCGTVVEYNSDDDWWFVLDTDKRKTKARTKPDGLKWIGDDIRES